MSAKMNKNAEAWIIALESGKYQQGRSFLRQGLKDSLYCCLGVGCDLAVHALVIKPPELSDKHKDVGVFMYGQQQRCSFLPTEVAEWLGLPFGVDKQLINMNDHLELDFKAIAKFLKEEVYKDGGISEEAR